MSKRWFIIKNENTQMPEIAINGYIGNEEGETGYASFKDAIKAMKANGVTRCAIDINSGGGDMNEGLAIYDEAQASGIDFDVTVTGMAASMAGILAYMGKGKPKLRPSARLMFHKPQMGAAGEADALRDMATLGDSLEQRIKDILVARTGNTKDVVDSWFKPGRMTWMNCQEAVKAGIADATGAGLEGEVPAAMPMPVENTTDKEMWYKVYNSITNTNTMKLSVKMLALLALTMSATDEQIEAAIESKLKEKDDEIKSLKNKATEDNTARAKVVIDNAIKDKKITEADREEYTKNYLASPAFVENALAKMSKPVMPKDAIKGDKPEEEGSGNEDRSKWTVYDWQKKDFRGLEAMKTTNYAGYKKLYAAIGVDTDVAED